MKLKAGDDILLRITVQDGGVAVDLTGGTLTIKIAKNILTSDLLALYFDTITIFTDAANGIHDEVIAKETSVTWAAGQYLYQIQFSDSTGITRSEEIGSLIIEATLFE